MEAMDYIDYLEGISYFIITIIAIFLALRKNRKFYKNHPDLHGYAYIFYWGYICYLSIPLMILVAGGLLFVAITSQDGLENNLIPLGFSCFYLFGAWLYWILAKGYMARRRWPWYISMGFLLLCILLISISILFLADKLILLLIDAALIIFFYLHYIYLKKRWKEMG